MLRIDNRVILEWDDPPLLNSTLHAESAGFRHVILSVGLMGGHIFKRAAIVESRAAYTLSWTVVLTGNAHGRAAVQPIRQPHRRSVSAVEVATRYQSCAEIRYGAST